MNRQRLSLLLFAFLVLWVMLIFYFSSQPPDLSHKQSYMAVRIIKKINDIFDIRDNKFYMGLETMVRRLWFLGRHRTPNALVRKSAHFGIYFILGILTSSFAYAYSKKILIGFLLGFSLPVVVAVLDEFNQVFVGRTSSLTDVIIDGAGALTGTCFVIVILFIIKLVKLFSTYNSI